MSAAVRNGRCSNSLSPSTTPRFIEHLAAQDRTLPEYVQRQFEDFLKCGRLDHRFLRVRCQDCHSERLAAFSCKRRAFCPSRGARRMVESAALLVDDVLPRLPMVAPANPCARDINAVHACHASGS